MSIMELESRLLLINLLLHSKYIYYIFITIAAYLAASLEAAYYPAFSAPFKTQSGAPGIYDYTAYLAAVPPAFFIVSLTA